MVVVDANVLLYAVNSRAKHHESARSWLDAALGGREAVGLAWIALLAVVRLGTQPAVLPAPLTPEEAMDQMAEAGTAGNLTTDAHLAALALEHRATLVSYDRDMGRFAGVRHRLPG